MYFLNVLASNVTTTTTDAIFVSISKNHNFKESKNNSMATIKSFTTLEQSKKLTEILPLESADMMYQEYETVIGDDYGYNYRIQPFFSRFS